MPNPPSSKFSLSFSLPHGFADLFCGYPRIFNAALWKGSLPHLSEFLDFDVVYTLLKGRKQQYKSEYCCIKILQIH
jgi:hypothetical protein